MANGTQTKTKSVTNTKLAVATAFLGFAALAAAAAGGSGPKACIAEGVVTATNKAVGVCAGQIIEYKDTYGTSAYFYVKGFNSKRAAVVPLNGPGDVAIYAVGSPSAVSIMASETKIFNFPSGNGFVTHQLKYFRPNNKGVGYFRVGSTGPSEALTCGDIGESVISNSFCAGISDFPYACFNKYTGAFSGCTQVEDDFSNCWPPSGESEPWVTCSVVAEPSCEDSDGGLDYGTAGTVTFTSSSYTGMLSDYCGESASSTFGLPILHEYSCNEVGPEQDDEYCEFGCVDGACADQYDGAYGSPSSSLSGLPDLVPTNLSFQYVTSTGGGIEYTLNYENQGLSDAQGPFYIGIFAHTDSEEIPLAINEITSEGYPQEMVGKYVGIKYFKNNLPPLPSGTGVVHGSIPFSVIQKGMTKFSVKMDLGVTVEESNEMNNKLFVNI